MFRCCSLFAILFSFGLLWLAVAFLMLGFVILYACLVCICVNSVVYFRLVVMSYMCYLFVDCLCC